MELCLRAHVPALLYTHAQMCVYGTRRMPTTAARCLLDAFTAAARHVGTSPEEMGKEKRSARKGAKETKLRGALSEEERPRCTARRSILSKVRETLWEVVFGWGGGLHTRDDHVGTAGVAKDTDRDNDTRRTTPTRSGTRHQTTANAEAARNARKTTREGWAQSRGERGEGAEIERAQDAPRSLPLSPHRFPSPRRPIQAHD